MTPILVTGASGTVGSEVVRRLRDAGAPVRAFVRDAGRAAAAFGAGVDIVAGDFGDPATIDAALKGVDRVFLACPNHPRQVEYETNVIDAGARAGIGRLVKLSAHGATAGSPLEFWDWQGRIEDHLDGAGMPAVVLRPNFYMSNLLASADAVRGAGRLFLPAAGARVAMVDPRDVAAAAVGALCGSGDTGRRYVLTGPSPVTFDEVAVALGTAAGHDVAFIDVPDDAARGAMAVAGVPAFIAENLIRLFGLLREGAQQATTDGVRTLAGRPPTAIAVFASDHARAFAR